MKLTGKLIEIGDCVVIETESSQQVDIRGLTHEQIRAIAGNFMADVTLTIESPEVSA